MPALAASDLADRRPVWAALSDLYLDTTLTPAMLEADARRLAASPYSLAELRAILADEVHPACAANLLATAGEWVPFDPAWLEQRILARRRSAWRWPSRLLPLRGAARRQADPLFARVAALRGDGAAG
jgi:hypothetical protein